MRRHVLFVLFVFLMSLFTSTFVSTLQESDDNSDEPTTVWPRQRRGRLERRCPIIWDSLSNGWVRMRNRGRIAKFTCNPGYILIGNRVTTCIQGRWNYPVPVCAIGHGCIGPKIQKPYKSKELFRGSVLEISCDPGYSLSGTFSVFRLYCNGTKWKILGTDEELSKTETNPYQCKKSDTSETESYFITTEEISTNSPQNSAVTAKTETTTNSKFNSKIPEMTAMFVSPVININAMSTESTSLFADKSKTPVTESIDKSYTFANTTNIIQEMSTLTTTTTIRLNTLQSQRSSTQTTPKIQFTTLSKELTNNDTNIYSTKLPKLLSINTITEKSSQQNSTDSTQTTLTSLSATDSVSMSSTTPEPELSSKIITTTITTKTTPIGKTITELVSTTPTVPVPTNSTTELSTPKFSLPQTTTVPVSATLSISQSMSPISTTIKTTTLSTTSRPESTQMSTLTSKQIIRVLTTSAKNFSEHVFEVPSKYVTTTQQITTQSSVSITDSIRISSTNSQMKPTKVSQRSTSSSSSSTPSSSSTSSSSSLKTIGLQTTSESRATTIPLHLNDRYNRKTSSKKVTKLSTETYTSIGKRLQTHSSKNPLNYTLFTEQTTMTPLRRRRQFSTKTSLVSTSIASESNKNTKRVVGISVAVISLTILVTTLSLYLIKKRNNIQQNRLTDDSEMRYLSSNEVF